MENIQSKNEEIINKNEFRLMKNNIFYEFILERTNDSILLKYLKYKIIFKLGELSIIANHKLNSIEEEFNYLKNLFFNNRISIKEILPKKSIILNINEDNNSQNKFYIYLSYKDLNKDFIINRFYNKSIILEKESNKLKNMEKKNSDKNFSNNINLKPILNIKSFTRNPKEYTFTIFCSLNNILCLIYGTKDYSIICYNLNDNKKKIEIKNAHDDDIIGFNHFFDKKNKTDLIMSFSSLNFLKIWRLSDWECILYLQNINKMGLLSSACFLSNNGDECYIVTSNSNIGVGTGKIKIYNLKAEIIKEINNSNEDCLLVNTYLDEDKNKIFIIACSKNYVKSYDYNDNKLYHKYNDNTNGHHCSTIINKKGDLVKLIESCTSDGFIRIWNFHYGNLLSKIKTNAKVCSLCLWNNKYIFCGIIEGLILLIDLENQIVIKIIEGHKNWVNYIQKFKNEELGECLITQGFDDLIKIWSNQI